MPKRKKEKGIRGFGSVYQRGSDKRYVAKYKAEGTKRGYKEEYARTEGEAYAKLEKAYLDHKQGILATGPQRKLKDHLREWYEQVQEPNLRLSSQLRYNGLLNNHILPELGHIQIRKLTAQHIQSFYARKLKGGLSASSVRSMHKILHKALDNAVKWRLISYNPSDDVTLPKVAKKKVVPLSLEQARHLIETAQGHPLEAFVAVAVTTGMRHGELTALRWDDINWRDGSLYIHRTLSRLGRYKYVEGEPKTEKGVRLILIPHFVLDLLKAHRTHQLEARLKAGEKWQEHNLVFCNRHGTFLHPDQLRASFYHLLESAGLPRMRIHDLRHSAATLLLDMGINPKQVQALLGHGDISMTMDYSHVIPSVQREVAEKLNTLFQR